MIKTSEGKVILFAVADGKQGAFWPIDARAHLAAGTHTSDAPEGVTPVMPPVAPESVQPPRTAVAETFVAPEGEAPAAPKRRTHHPARE